MSSPFAALGAFGPDLLLYTPPSAQLAGDLASGALVDKLKTPSSLTAADLQEFDELFHRPLGAAYATLFSQLIIPVWPVLTAVTDLLATAQTIADSEDEDALSGFFSQAQSAQSDLTGLGSSLQGSLDRLLVTVTAAMALGPWMEENASALVISRPPADPRSCRTYEFLRWHRSGAFAAALLNAAGTDNQRAFALGWASHVAASVCAEPFVNNIAGGPYRTHWWRNRLAQNFVDAWTFGFSQTPATMSGDEPSPAYVQWASLCEANAQDTFNAGGLPGPASPGALPSSVTALATGNLGALPQSFPDELADLIDTAIDDVYPANRRPIPDGSLASDTFRDAYVGAHAVFWFLTSGTGPLGNNLVGDAPAGCGTTAPSWLTGSAPAPAPQQGGVTSGSTACEIVLAILAVLALLGGDLPAAIVLLVAALEEQPSIDWDKVRCIVWQIRSVYAGFENTLRDALVFTALAYPPPILLGGQDTNGHTEPATDFTGSSLTSLPPGIAVNAPPLTGTPLTRTNALSPDRKAYPRDRDRTSGAPDLHWFSYPASEVEADPTSNLIADGLYPDAVLDGPGLLGGGMLDPGTFPTRGALFGDAVSNAVAVIENAAADLADFNLDADRGYGWLGWHPQPGSHPATPPVKPVAD